VRAFAGREERRVITAPLSVLLECRAGQRLVAEVHPGGEQRSRLHASIDQPWLISVRSRRKPRNRCTRTVDSLRPVASLTSRVVRPSR